MSIQVFIPFLSKARPVLLSDVSRVDDLLDVIWKKEHRRLEDKGVKLSDISLRALVSDL